MSWRGPPPRSPELNIAIPPLDDLLGGYTNAVGVSPTVFSVMEKPVSEA